MKEAVQLEVGDEVLIYWDGASNPSPATVEKIGRTLVHLRSGGRVDTFRLDNQRRNHRDYGYASYFRTPAQDAEARQADAAKEVLRERGMVVKDGHSYTAEQLSRIVALIDTFK